MPDSRLSVAVLGLIIACGPKQGAEPDDATGSTSSSPPTTGEASSQGDAPPPETSGTTVAPPLDSTGTAGSSETGIFPEMCSVWDQDCPPDYKCMPWSNDGGGAWNDTKCIEIAEDPGHVGEPCTVVGDGLEGIDDCDGTTMCWDVDPETNLGTCREWCTGSESDPHCSNDCDVCFLSSDGLFDLCFTPCDPQGKDCDPGQACTLIHQGFFCAPAALGEPANALDPCEFNTDCVDGLACMSGAQVPGCASSGCCTPVCSLDGPDSCADQVPGTWCQAAWNPGYVPDPSCPAASLGVCLG